MNVKFFRFKAPDLAMDMGSATIRAVRLSDHWTIQEPAIVALDFQKKEILSAGQEAKDLLGKSPDHIVAVRPIRHGAIADFDLTQALLEHEMQRLSPPLTLLPPRVTISFPSGSTDVEQRALEDACRQAGAREVFLVEESLAAAYGAGAIRTSTSGALIVNMGAGTTQVAVVNSYGAIAAETLKMGGDDLDADIRAFIHQKYDLVIGKNTAEEVKIRIGSLREDRQRDAMEVSGRDVLTGMPKSIDIYASDVTEAMKPFIDQVLDLLMHVLEKTPPELASDVMTNGAILTGAGAQIDGLVEFLSAERHLHVRLSDHPAEDTIRGCVYMMANIDALLERGERDDSNKTK